MGPFSGLAFEHFVRRNAHALLVALGASDVVTNVGTYWHRPTKARPGVQIDLVIEREDGVTHLVECKWSRKPIGQAVVEEIERKRGLYPNPRGHTLAPALVASGGASQAVLDAGIPVVSLEDLFRAP